jgi:hypothetical protein
MHLVARILVRMVYMTFHYLPTHHQNRFPYPESIARAASESLSELWDPEVVADPPFMYLTLHPPDEWTHQDFRMELRAELSVISFRIVPRIIVVAARTLPVVFHVEDYYERGKTVLAGLQHSKTSSLEI